jgi:class 3 adenylate cyclase
MWQCASGSLVADYGLFSRAFHSLALGSTAIARASFDVDQSLSRGDVARVTGQKHVFVSGLARAGTTVLLRLLYATGAFSTLTYRDMPFVLMPSVWRRLSQRSRRASMLAERAHGDGILVDFDSPEAFEEVFWRTLYADRYLHADHLGTMAPDAEIVESFRKYVASLLADTPDKRYLSKNNNNVVRLPAIHVAFPEAVLLIPFRDPMQHAWSLMRQHALFSREQAQDTFIRDYMTWLGHHEFGLGHRPFRFGGAAGTVRTDSLDYWLGLWREVYGHLEATAPEGAVFLSYEVLCERTGEVWSRLAAIAEIEGPGPDDDALSARSRSPEAAYDASLAKECGEVYARLMAQMQDRLGLGKGLEGRE